MWWHNNNFQSAEFSYAVYDVVKAFPNPPPQKSTLLSSIMKEIACQESKSMKTQALEFFGIITMQDSFYKMFISGSG
jgi:hypothetical protein